MIDQSATRIITVLFRASEDDEWHKVKIASDSIAALAVNGAEGDVFDRLRKNYKNLEGPQITGHNYAVRVTHWTGGSTTVINSSEQIARAEMNRAIEAFFKGEADEVCLSFYKED
jgi:hypothetical protein